MQQNRKRMLMIFAVLIFAVLIALVYWLKPNSIVSSDASNATHSPLDQVESSTAIAAQAKTGALAFASASQQDIQINCQLKIDGSNRLIVNEATKNCFEFFITQYGEKDIQQIKTDFVTYANASYTEPLLSQLTDLWSRYMQYREQLGNLEKPNIDEEKAGYYKAIFNNMKNLRKKFFSDYEIEGLFGIEDTYNDYTIARMEVLDNKKLTEAEKAQKLQELFKDLPEDWKENLKQLSQLEDLRKLTAEIKARGGSAEELHQMRTNLVGPEATQRLEILDADRNQWKGRVGSYLTERDSIVKSNMSDSAKQSAIQQLRSKNFSNPQEQLRIETFEKIHDEGRKLPLSD
ncbi:lipase chaperone [Acinetobacter sp. TGL-Y2]|uniref:lipase secretion chaperone n=1 Tax=Acinetobacter sp. TGL-Y2 TaxID=1407071 RepID=UPI0007A6670E|nr:lipase secretion chaperone [Acinetobacter sp. TGL-Y2]AMW77736.1 lipase chaperone [Acinetobacter sp. TGL-Y2]